MGTDDHVPPPVLVGIGIHQAALGKVRDHLKWLLAKYGNLSFKQLGKIVRQDARGDSDRDSLSAEHEQKWDLRRERDRLAFAPIVGRNKFG